MDSWVLWHLTGGADGGRHLTDVTNASRTMLMDLTTLDWDDELLDLLDIPRSLLPKIVPSAHAEHYGTTRADGPFGGEVTIGGALGDQHAAMVGQVCLAAGEAKNTYGTGNFLLLNTGPEICRSSNGLLTTVCYQLGDEPATYALEGSIAVTGSAVQWLRDQLKIISSAAEIEAWPGRSRMRAGRTSCRRSPGCSRRTGAPTPAGRSWACPASTPTPTWPGRRWTRSATRAVT